MLCLFAFVGIGAFAQVIEVGQVIEVANADGVTIYYHLYNKYDNSPTLEVIYRDYKSQYNDTYTGSVVIPESVTYNGVTYSVVSISSYAFYGCSNLTHISIPESVTNIGSNAFEGCSSLVEVNIPNGVTDIYADTFKGCSSLTKVAIPSSVRYINSAFLGCTSLTDIVFSDGTSNLSISRYPYSSYHPFADCPIERLYIGRHIEYSPANSSEKSIFHNNKSLQTVVIGDSIKEIDSYLFCGCRSLTSVTIPNNVTSIGRVAFEACESLTSISIPNSVTSIGDFAFMGCKGLTAVTIPCSITSIASSTFSSCKNLTSITIPSNVTSIGEDAFKNCEKLSSVTIQDWADELKIHGESVFHGCPIEKVYLGRTISGSSTFSGHKTIKSLTIGNYVASIDNSAFMGCSGLTSITIPENVTSIGNYAFQKCSSLTSANIPINITSIGKSAFDGCKECKLVYLSETPLTLKESIGNVMSLEVPLGTTCLYARSDYWKDITCIYAVDGGRKHYPILLNQEGDGMRLNGVQGDIEVAEASTVKVSPLVSWNHFHIVLRGSEDVTEEMAKNEYYSFIPSVHHQDNIVEATSYPLQTVSGFSAGTLISSIGVDGVEKVRGLKVVGDVNGTDILAIRKMSNMCFLDMKDARIVSGGAAYYKNYTTANDKVGTSFFQDMTNLKKVVLPKNVTLISQSAFYQTSNLLSISIPQTVEKIEDNAFSGCNSLQSFVLEDGNKELTFNTPQRFAVKRVHLGRNVVGTPFANKTTIQHLTIGGNVSSVGASAFTGCTSLKDVVMEEGVETIGKTAFSGCSSLAGVTIGNSVTSIGAEAFKNCSSMAEVTIGSNVTSIGTGAFSGCSSLATVISLNPTPPNIASSTFDSATEKNAELYVPTGCEAVYWLYPYWENFLNIREGIPNTIEDVCIDSQNEYGRSSGIYTISGVKCHTANLSDLPSGIYIMNGKKVYVK